MYILNILFCALVLSVCEKVFVSSRVCYDCVSIRSCESALNLATTMSKGTATSRNTEIFAKALCGFDGNTPKVCCSDFPVNTVSPTIRSLMSNNVAGVPRVTPGVILVRNTDEVETHPNVKLLPDNCGDIDGSRIVGGIVAKLYEFPWMALISYNTRDGYKFNCGGSVINSRYILTAAHCVISNGELKNIAGVRIGEINLSTDIDCQGDYPNMICESKIQDMAVEDVIPHEDYTGRFPVEADIALLRLTEPIDLTQNNAAPICLPVYKELRDVNLAQKIATVAGWGFTENKTYSDVLLKVDIPILPKSACRHIYNRYRAKHSMDTSFCAGESMKDSCDGDSGGPLIIEDEYNSVYRYIQYGIVSYGPRKCGSDFPGVYTEVSKYMLWILNKIKD